MRDVDLAGKRVAIIGTGASAVQFIPFVADEAEHLTIYQRTPPWLLPVPTYQLDLPDGLRWLLRHVPDYARWDRLWIFARTQEGLLPMATVDPEWEPDRDRSARSTTWCARSSRATTRPCFPDPELRAKVLPDVPADLEARGARRRHVPAALQRDDVTLDTIGHHRDHRTRRADRPTASSTSST